MEFLGAQPALGRVALVAEIWEAWARFWFITLSANLGKLWNLLLLLAYAVKKLHIGIKLFLNDYFYIPTQKRWCFDEMTLGHQPIGRVIWLNRNVWCGMALIAYPIYQLASYYLGIVFLLCFIRACTYILCWPSMMFGVNWYWSALKCISENILPHCKL